MHRQRFAFLTVVVSAAVLTGHALGYQIAGLAGTDHHGYMGPVASLLVPLGLAAIVVLGRNRGWTDRPSGPPVTWPVLVAAQVGVYLLQEIAETVQVEPAALPHLLTNRSVLAGLAAQPLIAWLVVLALRTTRRIGARLTSTGPPVSFEPRPGPGEILRQEDRGWPSAVPTITRGRAPPLENVIPI